MGRVGFGFPDLNVIQKGGFLKEKKTGEKGKSFDGAVEVGDVDKHQEVLCFE